MMGFVQIIDFRTSKYDEMRKIGRGLYLSTECPETLDVVRALETMRETDRESQDQ